MSPIYYNVNRDPTVELGRDRYQVPMYVNDYYVNGNHYTFPVQSVSFVYDTLCDVLSCLDYTGCWTGAVSPKIGNTYFGRTCNFAPVICNDGNSGTYDFCVPPVWPNYAPNMPPKCVYTPNGAALNGFCYYINGGGYNCQKRCFTDSNCGVGGVCYPTNCISNLQDEELESANGAKHQSVGSLSPLQLFGIIGGCVCFVVVAVVVIYKFIQARKMNEDTIASLQEPLN